MKNDTKNAICPECGKLISVDAALTNKIEVELNKALEGKNQVILAKKEEELKKQLQKELLQSSKSEMKLLEQQLKEKDAKLLKANENEIVLRKEKNKLEEAKKDFKIDKQRQLDEERKGIFQEASKKATEEQHYVIAQLKKQLSDATKVKDELARKLEQGSQQSQGEVLELELEELLRSEFKYDDISPVPKGVNGADIIQTVKTKAGVECGKIIWESKKTKSWTEGWIQKLKDDQRAVKADLAVIVSSVLPRGIEGMSEKDGVYVCDIKLAVPIATLLRHSLEAVSRIKTLSVGKNEKMEVLFSYLTGTGFTQRIKAIREAFLCMEDSLKKERIVYEKNWLEREKQIQKVIKNTAGIYTDLNGVVQLQKIEFLELPESSEN
jgi:hypothetical protein